MIMATTATKSASPALGAKDWLETVRTLAPNARIPYIAVILRKPMSAALARSRWPKRWPTFAPTPTGPRRWILTVGSEKYRFRVNGRRAGRKAPGVTGAFCFCFKNVIAAVAIRWQFLMRSFLSD
jgi:hypothetical protein